MSKTHVREGWVYAQMYQVSLYLGVSLSIPLLTQCHLRHPRLTHLAAICHSRRTQVSHRSCVTSASPVETSQVL